MTTGILTVVLLVTYRDTLKIKTHSRREAIPVHTRAWRKKNQGARLVENGGGGDCLFYCFQQAMSSTGQRVSVKRLRKAVAREMGDEQLGALKAIYDTSVKDNNFEMLADYNWMRGVETLDQLKQKITSREYYGDDMAIPILERETGLSATIVKEGQVQKRLDKPVGSLHIVLLLKDIHYRIVSLGGKLVFSELPREAVEFARSKA